MKNKLKGYQHGIRCDKHKEALASYEWEGKHYCKRGWKKLRSFLGKAGYLQGKKKKRRKSKKKSGTSFKQKRRTVTERVLRLRQKATPAERAFEKKLEVACPVKFKFQRGFIKGGYYAIVDFFIPSWKLCIEIDGPYHDRPEQQKKDKYRDKWLREVRQLKVIRLTNEQAFNISVDDVRTLIALKGRVVGQYRRLALKTTT